MGNKRRLIIYGGRLSRTGGIETHLFNFCFYLAHTFDIHFIISSLHFNKEKKEILRQKGVNIYEFSFEGKISDKLKSYSRILLLINKLKKSSKDIFYTNAFTSNLIYVIKCIFNFKIWIHHHHSDFSNSLFFSYPYLYKRVFKRADFLILCTQYQVQQFQHMNFKPQVICLPYCKMENTNEVAYKEFNGVICYLGRVLISKGIDYVLNLEEKWLLANEIKCHIYGNNELDEKSIFNKKLTNSLSDPFFYFGEYNGEKDVEIILHTVSITIIPSTGAEGLPLVFTESISRGIPVIAFDGGGLRDYKSYDEGVIITPPSMENLKTSILEMKRRLKENKDLGPNLKHTYNKTLHSNITIEWWNDTFN